MIYYNIRSSAKNIHRLFLLLHSLWKSNVRDEFRHILIYYRQYFNNLNSFFRMDFFPSNSSSDNTWISEFCVETKIHQSERSEFVNFRFTFRPCAHFIVSKIKNVRNSLSQRAEKLPVTGFLRFSKLTKTADPFQPQVSPCFKAYFLDTFPNRHCFMEQDPKKYALEKAVVLKNPHSKPKIFPVSSSPSPGSDDTPDIHNMPSADDKVTIPTASPPSCRNSRSSHIHCRFLVMVSNAIKENTGIRKSSRNPAAFRNHFISIFKLLLHFLTTAVFLVFSVTAVYKYFTKESYPNGKWQNTCRSPTFRHPGAFCLQMSFA